MKSLHQHIKVICIIFALILTLPAGLASQDLRDDPEAREIFEELDRRRRAITYETSTLEMTIHDNRGRTRVRNMTSYDYSDGDVSKTLIVFNAPADVRGTGLLTTSEGGTETQRLWLPALGRVQIISGSQRGERFMGSDFTYEDLETNDSQYDHILFHIHPEHYKLLMAEYINTAGEVVKRLTATDYSEVLENLWRAGMMTMEDLKTGRKTELRWSGRTFNEPIPDQYFTERQLTRGVQ
ncbi:MAG: outer membrane lipoprotein-sorting protein [Rhodothermaceae bacterium]|nr:outer membrane lipoprotein-sorting protein [Rhodothermaceae bacterium]